MKFSRLLIVLLTIAACAACGSSRSAKDFSHDEMNSVYYWKTVFAPDSVDYQILKDHEVGRVYLRMFDVDVNDGADRDVYKTAPVGTLKIPDEAYSEYRKILSETAFVPVVYITLDALEISKDNEGQLAQNIVERVKNMCSFNDIPNVEGLQLDCDWTESTEPSFFALCDSVRYYLNYSGLDWNLSSTIRLHQLARQAPPVDYGVLMVYNTGNFNDPDEENSIITRENVEPYLRYLKEYPLHLDVAYPTYSWQLLFRNRRFIGLLNGLDLQDTAMFARRSPNQYVVLKNFTYNNKTIFEGDIIKLETSDYNKIIEIKELIETRLKGRPHSNILYHLDSRNFSKYSDDELSNIFAVDKAN